MDDHAADAARSSAPVRAWPSSGASTWGSGEGLSRDHGSYPLGWGWKSSPALRGAIPASSSLGAVTGLYARDDIMTGRFAVIDLAGRVYNRLPTVPKGSPISSC
jgi:hypothetical protein